MQQFTNLSREIRSWIVLLLSVYLIFAVVVPAVGVLLYAEEVANEALKESVNYISTWWNG